VNTQPMIEARGLTKRFGPIVAVDEVSLALNKGEVLGFLGPNGAGKTTTMKMLMGFLSPSDGTARICGHDVFADPIAARSRIGYLPEGAPLYEDMTPRGLLRFVGEARGFEGEALDTALTAAAGAVHITPVLDQPIETLSKGYRRRVGLAQALLHDPDVLILDEPTDGLDPNQKHEVRALLTRIAKDKAIMVSTHLLEEVEALCTRAVVIDRGRIVADGTPAELKSRSRYAGAVTVQLAAADAAKAAEILRELDGVQSVEERAEGSVIELTVTPEAGAELLEAVRCRLAQAEIALRQIALEAGRLDDVFRNLTHSDLKERDDIAEDAA